MSILIQPTKNANAQVGIDEREALFNEGASGPIERIQVSTERICSLRGILYDLDPDLFRPGILFPNVPRNPAEFYDQIVQPMLSRHPVLAKAEVRSSGRGIHAILRFIEPVEFKTEGERDRWVGIVEVVQAALPIDPDQPGITANTRALGSINSKNGAEVTLLAAGEPVTADEVLGLFDEIIQAPFKTVMRIFMGDASRSPCPFCGKAGTRLNALERIGQCYGSCGNRSMEQLYDLVLVNRDSGKEGGKNA